ncbi:MAG TPA: hypothetical protein VJ755_06505, partial [Gemmatimonadales bacterium]|nr:hypothetical protein [Gemmatimonadales bacterium]
PPNVVTITATDFAFGAPDTIPAGLTTLRLLNHGREPHQAVLFGAPGKTFEELEAAQTPQGTMEAWWQAFLKLEPTFPGGPGVVMGGDSSIITAHLEPGNYEIVCFIPSPDGTEHVKKGMFRRLVVTSPPSRAAEPKADLTVTLSDFAFALSQPVTAGTHTIRVENTGPQLHELTVERLAPGKTLADWQRWIAGGMKGEPVSVPVGGFAGPDQGKVGWVTLTFTPGNYLFLCYVPDRTDGRPHFLHGMAQQITVGQSD